MIETGAEVLARQDDVFGPAFDFFYKVVDYAGILPKAMIAGDLPRQIMVAR